ncbi:hypothetical protein [Mesorhizobium huakuii]|uniref:Uncharacterized protein n=1 Tax=Mesorhizobium huakuii TaxID=28104 RepID=A0A7G6T0U8_9HYPH|nr:hypothetical protein [Mesorhizobium huakuii]QND60380.1 hypothetical protein HB778_30410 [Mesorhizobium huakuii]
MTDMVDIDDMLPFVMPHVPSAPHPTVLRNIRAVVRELCLYAAIWREYDDIVIATPDSECVCTIPDVAIVKIEKASLDGLELHPVTIAWLDENVSRWDIDLDQTSNARWITQLNPNTVTIVPKATGTLRVRLVLQPSITAEQIPNFILTDHSEMIGMAAAGRVMLTPKTEYTNPQLGAAYKQMFDSYIARMDREASKGQQRARLRTKPQFI